MGGKRSHRAVAGSAEKETETAGSVFTLTPHADTIEEAEDSPLERPAPLPLYPYRCTACGHKFERIQSFSAEPETVCPKCGGALARVLTAPGLNFKGAGWYINDYAPKSSGSSDSSSSDSSSDSKSDATKSTEKSSDKPAPSSTSDSSPSTPAAAPSSSTPSAPSSTPSTSTPS